MERTRWYKDIGCNSNWFSPISPFPSALLMPYECRVCLWSKAEGNN